MAQYVLSTWDNKCPLCSKKFQHVFALKQHCSAKHRYLNEQESCDMRTWEASSLVSKQEYMNLEKRNAVLNSEKERFRGENDRLKEELSAVTDERNKLKIENKKLAKELNQLKGIVEKDVQDQIELVGSKAMYDRVRKKIHDKILDPYFIEEQLRLYQWRKKFFCNNFGRGMWYTDGADDAHSFDTVPYQISQHFEEVVLKVSLVEDGHVPVHFECDELESAQVNWLFDGNDGHDHGLPFAFGQMDMESDTHLKNDLRLTFSQSAHMITNKCSQGPKSLLHQATKVVLLFKLPLDQLPEIMQLTVYEGLYSWHGPTPEDLTPEGKLRYEFLRIHYDIDESGNWDGWEAKKKELEDFLSE